MPVQVKTCLNCSHPILPALEEASFCSDICRKHWYWCEYEGEDGKGDGFVNADNQAENDCDA